MWDPYAQFQSETLSNGLTVHAAHWPGRPWEAMGCLIHSGGEYDPVGYEGVAHFVEHVVMHNANLSRKEMRAFFENCGGKGPYAGTNYAATHYDFFVPCDKEVLARAFSMLGQMLLVAKLEKYIERERSIIVEEFHRLYPLKFNFDLRTREQRALYGGYWLERFVHVFGNPDSIGRITQDQLQSYYETHYTPANISIVGIGGMKLKELVELLSGSPFATRKTGVRTPLPTPTTDVRPPSETRYIFEASKHLGVPAQVGAYRSVAKIPGNINGRVVRIVEDMLDEVLSEAVREKRGWTYHIGCSRFNFRHFYRFSIDCEAFALKAIDDFGQVVEDCVAAVGDREDMFEQIRRRALASNFMVDTRAWDVRGSALEDLADKQRIITLTEVGQDLERMTMKDVRDLLQWLRPERRWTLLARP